MPLFVEIGDQRETTGWRPTAFGIAIEVVGIVVGWETVTRARRPNVRILTIFRNCERLELRVVYRLAHSISIGPSLSEQPSVLPDSKNLPGKTWDPQQANIG